MALWTLLHRRNVQTLAAARKKSEKGHSSVRAMSSAVLYCVLLLLCMLAWQVAAAQFSGTCCQHSMLLDSHHRSGAPAYMCHLQGVSVLIYGDSIMEAFTGLRWGLPLTQLAFMHDLNKRYFSHMPTKFCAISGQYAALYA